MYSHRLCPYTSFEGPRRLASGSLQTNALALKQQLERGSPHPVLVFDNTTGRSLDLDLRGSLDEVRARYAAPQVEEDLPDTQPPAAHISRGRGRPKLGVVAREVTLLPRHWDWLASQPGGASVALRKLVEAARRSGSEHEQIRKAHERAYYFIQTMAGDLAGFEEASRALFAHDQQRFKAQMADWPADIRNHALALASAATSS